MTAFLGIDVGSISTNMALVDESGEMLFQLYRRGQGNPVVSVQEGLLEVARAMPEKEGVAGVCTTGSGRAVIGALVGADIIKNEISAHARGAVHLHPDVRTIVEVGGQDSKVTIIRDSVVIDFGMNVVCAAGTGSFLDSQAKRLDISIEELGAKAVLSENPTAIAGRCTVFAESDMVHKQQSGHAQVDILMGLCQAMVRNFIANVCKGKEIRTPVVFQGGVSANAGIRRALGEALGTPPIIPRHNMVMGAYGAALLAADAGIECTKFRGFDVAHHRVSTRTFGCDDCENQCQVIEILDSGRVLNRSGGRCRKWEGNTEERQVVSS
jgi:predicted CoA-substrate-specific enzyme activase